MPVKKLFAARADRNAVPLMKFVLRPFYLATLGQYRKLELNMRPGFLEESLLAYKGKKITMSPLKLRIFLDVSAHEGDLTGRITLCGVT